MVMMLLVMLRSAGYFYPFFILSISKIVLIAIILSIPLLSANSKAIAILSLIFLFIALITRVAGVNAWAERAAIYFYQAFTISVLLYVKENIVVQLTKKK